MNKPAKIETETLASSMALAFAEIEAATKSADNPFFKSKYADLGSIIGTVKPALVAHGLFFTQHCHPSPDGVIVETVLHHAGGESMSMGQLYVPANKRDAQGFGSAQTYARRYALQTAFGVPTEDDDGNAATRTTNTTERVSDRPTTGETPPAKRVELAGGPHKSKTALWTAVRAFDRSLRGMGDLAEFEAFLQTEEVVLLLAQCEIDAPQLLDTGEGLPEEFEPLNSLIKRLRGELSSADESWRTNPIMAG
jgi:hypothetical protein